MKKEKIENNMCQICEIVLPVDNKVRIVQYSPLKHNRLLVLFTAGIEVVPYIANYLPAKEYIFRDKKHNSIILKHNSEFYGC